MVEQIVVRQFSMFSFFQFLRATHTINDTGSVIKCFYFAFYLFEVVLEDVNLIAIIVELSMKQVEHKFLHFLHLFCQIVELIIHLPHII